MEHVIYVLIIVAWFAIGAAVGLREARRGHWRWSWLPYSLVGPLAFPLARSQNKTLGELDPVVVAHGSTRRGPIDVLVGYDGSPNALAAGHAALSLLGNQVRRVTLAMVLDLDTAAPHDDSPLYPEPWPEETQAREQLELAGQEIERSTGHTTGAVILAGEPAKALERYAVDEGFELLVVGCRGIGLSKRVLGSCAEHLAEGARIPVLIIPRAPITRSVAA